MRIDRSGSLLLTALLALGGGVVFSGCGDEPQVSQRGSGRGGRSAKAKKKKKAAKKKDQIDESNLPVKLRGLKPADWEIKGDLAVLIREGRDPFLPYVADLLAVEIETDETSEDRARLGIKVAVPVRTLKFIAVITGTGVPRAMVEDADGVGHILRPGDVVGDNVPYRVARITRNQVVFKPLQAPDGEEKLEEVSKVLLTQEELAELLP
jgi:hypothetical protein